MRHGISEGQWLEYVDGVLNAGEGARIRRHTEDCRQCAQLLADLIAWRELLVKEAAPLQQALQLPDAELDSMLERSLERIRAAEPAELRRSPGWTAAEAMILLRSMMQPICGLGTARATIDLAIRRSTADRQGRVTGENWRLFIANLSDAIASVCGSAAGRLVSRVGVCLAIEEL